MKKLLLVIAIVAAFGVKSFAQRFEAGILAGFNGTQVDGDRFKGYHKPGILAGAYVQTDLSPVVFGAMEIKYSQKGSRSKPRFKGTDTGNPVVFEEPVDDPSMQKYIMRLNYIDMPAYVGFRTGETSAIVGGVSVGYLVSGYEFDDYGKFPPEDQNKFNAIDVQPFVGFQFDFIDRMKLDLRLAYSVLPIRGEPVENYYWLSSQYNNVISLALYYRLGR